MRLSLTILAASILFCFVAGNAQITFISTFTGNQGGATPLFGQHVPNGTSDMFIDFECFGSSTSGAGQGSIARAIVRGMDPNADGNSAIASGPAYVTDAIYSGENGNNDVYFVNLNVLNLPDGRYSIEIQCDEMGEDYDNSTGASTAATTWNYWPSESPTLYYLGTAGSCGLADGLEDINEVGESGVAGTPQLEYFNVGDVDVYRTMVVINGLFLDMGKFQPGNPTIPSSLHDLSNTYDPACVGVGSFPTDGFCSADALVISGAEVNVTKFTTCGTADVTGNRLFYRVYLASDPAPAFSSFNIPFMDNCPNGYPGAGVAFPIGGSCQNLNGILDQRWQTSSANIDILALATVEGLYNMDFYTETDIINCGGAASTVREPIGAGVYSTSFVRGDDITNPICNGLPVELVSFEANTRDEVVVLDWETASEEVSSHFTIERSIDGRSFSKLGEIEAMGESTSSEYYEFIDDQPKAGINYYRLKMVDLDGSFEYSEVRQAKLENRQNINVFPTNVQSSLTIELAEALSSDTHIAIYDMMGREVITSMISADNDIYQLDMSSLNSGTFIVRIHNQEINYSTKVIKR